MMDDVCGNLARFGNFILGLDDPRRVSRPEGTPQPFLEDMRIVGNQLVGDF